MENPLLTKEELIRSIKGDIWSIQKKLVNIESNLYYLRGHCSTDREEISSILREFSKVMMVSDGVNIRLNEHE